MNKIIKNNVSEIIEKIREIEIYKQRKNIELFEIEDLIADKIGLKSSSFHKIKYNERNMSLKATLKFINFLSEYEEFKNIKITDIFEVVQ